MDIEAYVTAALEQPWQEVFTSIDANPLASASIAQVHKGQLKTGEAIVVKVVRPGIGARIHSDMQHIVRVAEWIDDRFHMARRFHLPNLMHDHYAILVAELDLLQEAANQTQLRRNFAESDLLYVPRTYPEWSRQNLLTMEYVEGIPINHIEQLVAANVDLEILAHKGVETFFTQVFEQNFFHADMHQGNIFIDNNGHIVPIDFGIMGRLDKMSKRFLAEILFGFIQRDYLKVAEVHLIAGWSNKIFDILEAMEMMKNLSRVPGCKK